MQEIKKGWKKVKLGEVLEKIVGGGTPSKSNVSYWNGDIYWCSVKDMGDGVYKLFSTQDKISELGLKNSATNLIPKGNIIISTRMGLGRGFINQVDMAINQDLKALFPNSSINKSFLFWSYIFLGKEIESMGQGTTVKGIRLEDLRGLEILLPPLPTQQKIASILSKYDDLIENNNKRIKILEETAQAIYEEWFVKYNFPGSENIKMIDSGNDDFGMIPEGWEVKKVEEMIKKLPTGKKYDNKTVQEKGNIPVLDQGKSGIIGYHNEEPGVKASIENPIITFANHTCYQKIIMYPFSSIQNIFALISCNENKSNIFWLHYATKDLIKFNDYKGHMPEFITKKLLYPGFNLTEKFGDKIKGMIFEIYNLQKQNQNLKETRDLLIPRLVIGELDVESLDVK